MKDGDSRKLPFKGEVRELKLIGNGKDCVLQVWVPKGAGFAIPLSLARTSVSCGEGVMVDSLAWDDMTLEIRYRPAAGRRLRVVGATVAYPGSDEDWSYDCKIWKRLSRAKWPPSSSLAVSGVKVTLATWIDRRAAADREPPDSDPSLFPGPASDPDPFFWP